MGTFGKKTILAVFFAGVFAGTMLTWLDSAVFAQRTTDQQNANASTGVTFTENGKVIATLRATLLKGQPHLQLLDSEGAVTWSTQVRIVPVR